MSKSNSKSILFSLVLSAIGWGSLINVGLVVSGKEPLVPVPPQYMALVGIVACVWAFYIAMELLAVVGRIGLVVTSLPIFTVLAMGVQSSFGFYPACVAFCVPMFITLAYGMKGIISMSIIAIGAAFIAFGQ